MSTTLFFILLAIISLGINGLLAWYVIQILRKLLYTSDNIGDLYIVCRTYESFIQQIYEMDMFYGEPVLEELIQRTKLVRMEIEKFQEIYELTTDIEIVDEEEEDDYQEARQET